MTAAGSAFLESGSKAGVTDLRAQRQEQELPGSSDAMVDAVVSLLEGELGG